MINRAEIERLLNATGRTLEGLPKEYPVDRCRAVGRIHGLTLASAGNSILHQSDVIELLVGALRDALEEREAALAKVPKWISVDERLPESGVHVFVLCEIRANGDVIRRYVCDGFYVEAWKEKAGYYSEDCALVYNDEDDEYYLEEGWYELIKNWEEYNSITIDDFVTHWMPLPKTPEEEG